MSAPGPDKPAILTPAVWIVLAFGLACVVAGLLVARLGPQRPLTPPPAVGGDRPMPIAERKRDGNLHGPSRVYPARRGPADDE